VVNRSLKVIIGRVKDRMRKERRGEQINQKMKGRVKERM
jgi:hypothetical protein